MNRLKTLRVVFMTLIGLLQAAHSADPYFLSYEGMLYRDDGPVGVYSTQRIINYCGIKSSDGEVRGVSDYDLMSTNDKIVPVNVRPGSGQVADLIMYRPGDGVFWVQKFDGTNKWVPNWSTLVKSFWGMNGSDLKNSNDRIIPINYDSDDLTDLIVYRPGYGCVSVLHGEGNGNFRAIAKYTQGYNGYDFMNANDRIVVGDFNADSKQDILVYRPGGRKSSVMLSNGDGTFSLVNAASDLNYWDFASANDNVVVLDYDGDKAMDLVVFRAGSGARSVLHSNRNGTFASVSQPTPGGLAGYDLLDSRDQVIAADVNGDWASDLVLYRPGVGPFWVEQSNGYGTFAVTYSSGWVASSDQYGTDKFPKTKSFQPGYSDNARCVSGNFNGDYNQDLFCWVLGGGSSGATTIGQAIYGDPSRFGFGAFELGTNSGVFSRAWSSSYEVRSFNGQMRPFCKGVGGFPFNRQTSQVTVLKNAAISDPLRRNIRGETKDALLLWAPGYGYAAFVYLDPDPVF